MRVRWSLISSASSSVTRAPSSGTGTTVTRIGLVGATTTFRSVTVFGRR